MSKVSEAVARIEAGVTSLRESNGKILEKLKNLPTGDSDPEASPALETAVTNLEAEIAASKALADGSTPAPTT